MQFIWYEQKTNGVKRIAFNNRNYSSAYFIQMITTNKNEDGDDVGMRLTVYKCYPKRELELNFSSENSPAEITMSFECIQDEDGNVMDIIELEKEELPDVEISYEEESYEEEESCNEIKDETEQEVIYKKDVVPRALSREELMEAARKAGESPEIIEDEENHITFLDYSNLL